MLLFIKQSYQNHALCTSASRTTALVGFGCSAEILGQVLDAGLGAVAFGSSGIDGNELTIRDTASDVEDVFDLVELTTGAGEDGCGSKLLLECAGDLGVGVGLGGAGSDTSTSEPIVGGQIFEQRDSGVEEVHKLVFLFVVVVAVGIQGGVTSSVLAPFVLPERLVIALVVLPVGLHIAQDITMTFVQKDATNIGICSRAIACSFVRAITVVRPQTVNSPGLGRTCCWAGVPELSLQNLTLDFCAACV